MADTAQDTALLSDQWKNVTRARELFRLDGRIYQRLHGHIAIVSTNSRGTSFSNAVNTHRKGRFIGVCVIVHHRREVQFRRTRRENGRTNQSTSLSRHEIDHFWADFRGGSNEITFVLTVLIVNNNDHFAGFDILYCFFYGVKTHSDFFWWVAIHWTTPLVNRLGNLATLQDSWRKNTPKDLHRDRRAVPTILTPQHL